MTDDTGAECDVFGHVNTEFAHLQKLLWNSRSGITDSAVSPIKFKDKVAEFAKRFVGYRCACVMDIMCNFWNDDTKIWRIINVWNLLPDYIATSPTAACFKHRRAKCNFTL